MTSWQTLQPRYEKKAYRIVQNHIKSILSSIPYSNASLSTYEWLINANITEEDIKKMFVELYSVIGLDYGNRINKDLEKVTKANVLFNQYLLQQILLFLSNEGGVKITSVRDTLVDDVIKTIKDSLGENATVIDLQNAIYAIIRKSQTFYKWQSLRIARTETTTSSNFAAIKTAENSDLVLDKVWLSVQDNRTRITPYDHLDMNNQKQELDKPFYIGGQEIYFPGDPKASPGNTINCRCTVAFVPKRDADGMLILKN
jgi:hypothetical protein